MKKIINKILILALTLSTVMSCNSEPDNAIYEVFDGVEHGAILRTLELLGANFNLFDLNSTWGVVVEEQDEEYGGLLASVELYASYNDNKDDGVDNSRAEVLLRSIPASEFTTSANGLPSTTVSTTFGDALNSLNLAAGEYAGGDSFNFRLEVVLTDGRTFSSADASGALQGSYFKSPYAYKAGILCIPDAPIAGDYKIKMQDSYGDGWQGSKITVTIDGVATDYSLPDWWSSSDPYGPAFYDDQVIVNVPVGTCSLLFEWTSGDYPSECTFQIYGPNSGNIIADLGPSPNEGEIALNLCDE